ncbi:MAG TPA: carboxypeptidase regulatory-like domain-containing protein [Longimicrobiales bacterium]|nr:carboxypeptidase regulatory-like domain-containing protein [Longimicrobiales bacterium]
MAAWHADSVVVTGTVTDSVTGEPVDDAYIALLTAEGERVAATRTNRAGAFRLAGTGAGAFRLRIDRLGYRVKLTEPFEVAATAERRVQVSLAPAAVPLPGVPVETRSQAHLGTAMDGFYERRDRLGRGLGLGTFLGPEDLERRAIVGSVVALLETVPGIRTVATSWSNWRDIRLRPGDGTCTPKVLVDGIVLRSGYVDVLNAGISAADLAAVEIYRRPSEVPAEFSGPDARCGVLLLWTRRGR